MGGSLLRFYEDLRRAKLGRGQTRSGAARSGKDEWGWAGPGKAKHTPRKRGEDFGVARTVGHGMAGSGWAGHGEARPTITAS